MREWFSENASWFLYNYRLLLKAHFVLKCYEHSLSPPAQPPCLPMTTPSPSLLGMQAKIQAPFSLKGGIYKWGTVETRIQPGSVFLHLFVLTAHFLKWTLQFGIIVSLQKSCKDSTQSSVYPSPTSPNVNILHYCGTPVKAKKSTLAHYFQLNCRYHLHVAHFLSPFSVPGSSPDYCILFGTANWVVEFWLCCIV